MELEEAALADAGGMLRENSRKNRCGVIANGKGHGCKTALWDRWTGIRRSLWDFRFYSIKMIRHFWILMQ